jgi:excinuclease UvrABC ATPase subunit
MCPECEGLGKKMEVNLEAILDQSKSLNEGAILLPNQSREFFFIWRRSTAN